MNNNLEREITFPFLLRFTLPSIAMMVVMSLYTVVDGTFVSRLVGTDAFSAVNIIYPMGSLTIGLGTMFGTGLTALVSIKLGEGKREEANRALSFVILFTTILGAVLAVLGLIFLKPMIYALGANDAIYGYCYDYALPLIFFTPANILQLEFQTLYVADGKPHIGLFVTILGGLANVVLDYVFIAVFGMGISGAAIATGIGYSLPTLYGLCYFAANRSGNLKLVKPKADAGALLRTVTNGSSEMVGSLSTSVTTFLFNIILMRMIGQDGVAAVAILLYLDFVLIAVALGYSIGVGPLISYNYGGGRYDRLSRLWRLSAIFSMAVGIFMTICTIVFSRQLAGIFSPVGSSVYTLAVSGLVIYAAGYLFMGYNVFASGMFTALGDGRSSAILSFLRTFVFLVACLLLLPKAFGLTGVWLAPVTAEIAAFVVSVCFTRKSAKRYHYSCKFKSKS